MPMIELVDPKDVEILFEDLQKENRSDSLPVRGLLWNILSKRVKMGQIFVDTWPNPRICSCIHDSLEYSQVSLDVVTLFPRNGAKIDEFLLELKEKQQWAKKFVIFTAIPENLEMPVKRIFPGEKLHIDGPLMLAYDPYPGVKNRPLPELPKGLHLDRLREEETEEIVSYWPYNHPIKTDLFRFIIAKFPQICVRNSAGKPIAWEMEYECGAGAARFTLPEHRKTGLTPFMGFPKMDEHYRTSPVPAYGAIQRGNWESERITRDVFRFAVGADGNVIWIQRHPHKAQL